MTRQARIVDILLSSPSDVGDERKFVVEVARDWNSLRSKATGVFLNVLTWEDVVAPTLSDRPQSVINDAMGDEYDVYLGLMWGRFGTPTGAAESGTVEEFERALSRYRQGDGVRLAMLFKINDIPQAHLDGAQFDKVRDFKKRYAAEGGFYGEFDSDERLRRILNRLFEDIASSHSGPADPKPPTPPQGSRSEGGGSGTGLVNQPSSRETHREAGESSEASGGDISDLGLFEINDRLVEVTSEQVRFFEDLTSIHLTGNREIEQANRELEALVRFGQAEESQVKPIVSRIAGNLDRTASFLEERLPVFRERNDDLVALTGQGFDVASDFGTDNKNYIDFSKAVEEVVSTLAQNRTAIDGMIESASSLPRMSTQFNRAKKHLVGKARELRDEIDHLYNGLAATLQRYGQGSLLQKTKELSIEEL